MELILLAIGLPLYTAAIIKCTNIERDSAWRRWLHDPEDVYAPDGKTFDGEPRPSKRRRFESIED
jgi:hypothetical protein